MLSEQEEKYLKFWQEDLEKNRGLIVNQYEEVEAIMDHPILRKGFVRGIYTIFYSMPHKTLSFINRIGVIRI